MKRLLLLSLLVLLVPTVVLAGPNPNAKFCMHLIASDAYLYADDLGPMVQGLTEVNQDLSIAEIEATTYRTVYCVLCAYDVTNINCVEFYIEGWPEGGRPALPIPEIVWEVDDDTVAGGSLTLGNHWGEGDPGRFGGLTCFGGGGPCDASSYYRVYDREWWGDNNNGPPATTNIYPFGYFVADLSTFTGWPINLKMVESTFSYGADPRLITISCTPGSEEDWISDDYSYGCTIGGTYTTPVVTATEKTTWSSLKSLYRSAP